MPHDLREHLSQNHGLDLTAPPVEPLLAWGAPAHRVVSQEDTEALLAEFGDELRLRELSGDTTVREREAALLAKVVEEETPEAREDPASEEAGDTTVREEMAPLMAMAGHEDALEETRPQPNTVRSSPPVTARMGTLSIDDSLVFEPSEVAPVRRPTRPTPPVPLPTPPLPTPPLGEIAIPRDPPDRTKWWVLTIAAMLLALPVYQRLARDRAPAPAPAPQVEVQPLAVAPPEVVEVVEPAPEAPEATEAVEPTPDPEALEAAQAEAEREAKAKERARARAKARKLRARRRAAKAKAAKAAAEEAKTLDPQAHLPLPLRGDAPRTRKVPAPLQMSEPVRPQKRKVPAILLAE